MTENPPTPDTPDTPETPEVPAAPEAAQPAPEAEQAVPPAPEATPPPPPPPTPYAAQQPPPPPPYAGQQAPPAQPAYAAAPVSQLNPSEERTWASAAHWSALVASLVAMAFLGPLLVLLIQGNKSPVVRRNAVESLNFQLSILIYGIVSAVLVLVVIGILMLIAVGIMWLVFTILAAVKAGNGEDYRYPLTIRMVS